MEAEAAGVAVAVVAEAAGVAEFAWNELPPLGVGLGFRRPHRQDLFRFRSQVDFLEVTADHFFDPQAWVADELDLLRRHWPLIPHGLAMSLGSAEGLQEDYLERYARIVDRTDPAWCSEHIAFTRAGGVDIGHLTPLPRTRATLDVLRENIARFRQRVSKPLILENITAEFAYPDDALDEAEFLAAVCDENDVGLLLDVTNLYINSTYHGFDPIQVLHRLPRERIVQLHFVGGHVEDGRWIDSHSSSTPEEIWQLLDEVLRYAPVKGLILERDEFIPPLEVLLPELQRAQQLWQLHRTEPARSASPVDSAALGEQATHG